MKKKVFSLFFTLAVIVCLMPVALAEELIVNEQQVDSVQEVNSYDALVSAVENGGKIKLTESFDLLSVVTVEENTEVTLDLNGHTLSAIFNGSSTTNHLYAFHNYGSLIIQDTSADASGEINARGNMNYGVMTLLDGTINAIDGNGGYGIKCYDGSSFIMEGGKIATTYEDDHQVSSGGYDATPVSIDAGASFEMTGGNITNICDFTFAIENYGEATIENATVSSIHTTVVNGGTMSIGGGEFTCNGLHSVTAHVLLNWEGGNMTVSGGTFNAKQNYNGFVLDACAGAVQISGGTFNGSFTTCDESCTAGHGHSGINSAIYLQDGADITVTGGTFSYGIYKDSSGNGSLSICGGTWDVDVSSYLIYGYMQDEDGKVIEDESAVFEAKIGNVKYQTLFDAIGDVVESGKITLLSNVELTGNGITIPAGKTVTLDLAGYTLSGVSNIAGTTSLITNDGTLTIEDSSDDETGKITNQAEQPDTAWEAGFPAYANNTITNRGHLTIEGGRIESTTGEGYCIPIDNNSTVRDATLIVNGGTIIHTNGNDAVRMYANSSRFNNTVEVNDGTLEGYNAIWIHLPGSNGEEKLATLSITGGTLTSTDDTDNFAVYCYSFGDSRENVTITIEDGMFNGDVVIGGGTASDDSSETISITGGIFSVEPNSDYLAEGYIVIDKKDGWHVKADADVTLTFDTDSGSDVAPIVGKYGDAVIAPDAPTKTGYTFNEWDKTIPETMPDEDDTFTAQWTPNTYTIAFDSKGGSDCDSIPATYDKNAVLPIPTKSGYAFAGWNTAADGTGTGYENGQSAKNLTAENGATVTLYAQWTAESYTLTFDTDGGSDIDPIVQDCGTAIIAPDAPTKTGYTFAGWDTAVPETMPGEDMTFTALWTANSYTIAFDNEGGSSHSDIPATYDVNVTLPTPIKAGSNFAGWDTAEDGTGTRYEGGQEVKNLTAVNGAAVILHAQWTNKSVVSYESAVTQTATYDGSAKSYTLPAHDLTGFSVSYKQGETPVAAPTNAGAYDVIITRGEDASYAFFSKTLTGGLVIEKAQGSIEIVPSAASLTGGGKVTLTVTPSGLPSDAAITVTCDNGISVASNFTATLPNKTATYTFTAVYTDQTGNYEDVTATCTVAVSEEYYDDSDSDSDSDSGNSGGSSGGGSSSPTTPSAPSTSVTAPETSTAPTVSTETKTDASTGTTTTTETKTDGTVVETTTDNVGNITSVETQVDGTVIEKTENADGSSSVSTSKTEVKETVSGTATTTTTTETKTDAAGTTTASSKVEEKVETADKVTTTTTSTETKTDAAGKTTSTAVVEEKVETADKVTTTTNATTEKSNGTTVQSQTVAETVKNEDGTETTTSVNETTSSCGSSSTTTVAADGTSSTTVTVTTTAVDNASNANEAVALPMPEVTATKESVTAPVVSVDVPSSAREVTVEIPVASVSAGTVAVIVHADGTEEIVKTSTITENGVAVTLEGTATIKIVDNSKDFNDIPENYALSNSIDFVSARGLFEGNTETTFNPHSNTTVAQTLTVLARLTGEDFYGTDATAKGAEWGKELGLHDGKDIHEDSTREGIIVMMWKLAGSPESNNALTASDADVIAPDAQEAMRWAVEKGILKGNADGTINPKGNASRAHVAAFSERYVNII